MKTKIEHITCPSGDWEILKLNGETLDSGHSIPTHSWLEAFAAIGHVVVQTERTDEEMEESPYE